MGERVCGRTSLWGERVFERTGFVVERVCVRTGCGRTGFVGEGL